MKIKFVYLGMKENHLRIAKKLIEVMYNVNIASINFEDGSGSTFIVTLANGENKFYRL